MRTVTIYLSKYEKDLLDAYVGTSRSSKRGYFKNSLEKALKTDSAKNILEYPCNKSTTLSFKLPDQEFKRLVDIPSTKLGVTKHTYISNVLFNQLNEDFNIAYDEPQLYEDDHLYQFMTIGIDSSHFDFISNLRNQGVKLSGWLSDKINQFKDNIDLKRMATTPRSPNTERLHVRITNQDANSLKRTARKNKMTLSQLLKVFIDSDKQVPTRSMPSEFVDQDEQLIISENNTNNTTDKQHLLYYNALSEFDVVGSANDVNTISINDKSNTMSNSDQTSRSFNNDNSSILDKFYSSLVASISVFDTVRRIHMTRSFNNPKVAEYVYKQLQSGTFDFSTCTRSTDKQSAYTDIVVKFTDRGVDSDQLSQDFSDDLIQLT